MKNRPLIAAALAGVSFLVGCSKVEGGGDGLPRVAYVTNGVASFWTIAAAGAKAAAEEFEADCDVRMPNDVVDQKRIVEDLLTRGFDGIAISPIDAVNQSEMIDRACEQTLVITHDSDAPSTDRLCYVGMDNYLAGRMCGDLVLEALPDGGTIMLFVGRLEQDNAKGRRQGVIDRVLGRPNDPTNYDPPGSELSAGKYTILDTRTDQFARERAKANAEDALARYPDLDCMVGLFVYNTPACLEALRAADKLGEVEVVAFDEADETLQGILDGHVNGTIVQNPYRYGYDSVRILTALARGDESVVPESGFLNVPARTIRRDNVREFRKELRALLDDG